MSSAAPVLYRSPGCGSAIVEAAFTLADLPLRLVTASRFEGMDRLPELEKVNPLGQVPTLVWPDDTVQTESVAILIELALRQPEARLLPIEPTTRAVALRWLVYMSANLYAPFNPKDFPERWLPDADEEQRKALADGAVERIKHGWRTMEAHFVPQKPFAFGGTPGALDVAIAVMSQWTPRRAWFDRHCPRLAVVAHAADDWSILRDVWMANFGS